MSERTDTPTPSSLSEDTIGQNTITQWRTELLDKFTLYFLIAMFGVTPFLLYENSIIGDSSSSVLFLVATALCYVAMRIRSDKHLLRAGLFAVSTLLGAATGLLQGGFWAPEALIGMGFTSCVIALVLGRNYAWMTLAVSTAILMGFALYYIGGAAPRNIDNHELGRVLNWARILAIFIGTAVLTVTAIAHQAHKLESGVLQRNELIAQIEDESIQKLAAMTARQDLETKLQEARKLEALGQLAGGVAHDFNNLLVVIINTAIMLQDDAEGEELEDLKQIEDAGERASDLARQLLRFGQQRSEVVKPFSFNCALQSTLTLLKRLLPSNITVELDLSDTPPWISGSENELGQVIMNLCLNARDAMPEGGTLYISTQLEQEASSELGFLLLTLRDTGEGMSAETQSKIFDPFFTTKAVDKGTGLGLSVVHGVIEQHQGSIEVQSILGQGTTFSLRLPRCLPAEASTETPKIAVLPTSTKSNRTILVIDDNSAVISIMKIMLEKHGHTVLTSANGIEALSCYLKYRSDIDLIIVDAIMPEMGGREFYEEIRNLGDEPAVLFCSGYDSGTLPLEFFETPRRSLLMKPFKEAELLSHINELWQHELSGSRASPASDS